MLPCSHPDRIRIAFDVTAWRPMPDCFCRRPWPGAWACPNWWTGTLIWAAPQAGRTRATR